MRGLGDRHRLNWLNRGCPRSFLADRGYEVVFFSTSQAGQPGPAVGGGAAAPLADANDPAALAAMAVVVRLDAVSPPGNHLCEW